VKEFARFSRSGIQNSRASKLRLKIATDFMTASQDTVQFRLEHRTAWITLDRPPLNILDIPMMQSIDAVLDRALPSCDFMVFQGAGTKAFSAGVDVADHAPQRIGEMLSVFHRIFRRLAKADCAVIAGVRGYCLGGGMELATFCDFVIATESAQFGQPEIKLGCFPPVALITLPYLIGIRAAAHLILTGCQIGAAEAHGLGLVTSVVPDCGLSLAVDKLLDDLRALSPAVLRLTRKTLWRPRAVDFAAQLDEVERVYLTELVPTQDAQEGIRAFLEKRAPIWKGR
jgi:cyclohexa-1,5-dienecarbonyl-CoA hydratase